MTASAESEEKKEVVSDCAETLYFIRDQGFIICISL